ncbi:MAG: ABC-2 family transporter protein [Defluviitaleaceae bacterium]|nr:ABC-2 family transporter protein [Defluviitaleaceae bacterium]
MINLLKFILFNSKLIFKSLLVYRSATILKLVTSIFLIFIYIFLWRGIYGERTVLNGRTLEDIILFIIILRIIRQIYPLHIAGTYGNFIKNGTISTYLLKPISIEIRLFSQSLGLAMHNMIFIGLPSLITLLFLNYLPNISVYIFLVSLIWFSSAFIFLFLFELNIGVIGYYTTSLWGINSFKIAIISFLAGELIPLSFYPTSVLNLIYYLPFRAVYYIPISLLVGNDISDINISFILLWIFNIFLFAIYYYNSKRMIKKIMIQGG